MIHFQRCNSATARALVLKTQDDLVTLGEGAPSERGLLGEPLGEVKGYSS